MNSAANELENGVTQIVIEHIYLIKRNVKMIYHHFICGEQNG